MSREPRVLVLTGFPAIGGPLPKLTPLLTDGLRRAGFRVHVMGWSAHGAGREPAAVKIAGRSGDLVRVHRFVRRWRPDVIYVATAHNWPGLLRDLPLALSLPRGQPPLVIHFHGSESARLLRPGSRLFKWSSRLLVRRAAAVLLLSREEQREWRRFCPEGHYEVVLNPFVPEHQGDGSAAAEAAQTPVIFTVARLIPSKGIFDLLEAFAILRRRRTCRLAYAGTGESADELAVRVEELGLEQDVDLLGYVSGDALDAAYRRASVFALPTYFAEGFPLSIMEAMSYGLPVVTTPIRGCVDWLAEGTNAAFVPPRDPPELAATLARLLDDGPARLAMGRANAAAVAGFAPDKVVPAYADVLRSTMKGAPA
ncbi:MAG TPA: glycosyltransferase family 4 protein [Thermoleophilia bacterium]|nr:glycosyltransferase family 4 protein [Thermoleophilia bacterium]